MAFNPTSAPRLYLDAKLSGSFEPGRDLVLDRSQQTYLCSVLRLSEGAPVLVFNGLDGEWQATLLAPSRKQVALRLHARVRDQTAAGTIHYLFAPLKHARLDYLVQKAVEMGASVIRPVITRRTQATRINLDRMRANAIEAAEQCGILALPDIGDPISLSSLLDTWGNQALIFCDEDAPQADALATLRGAAPAPGPIGVLTGPEGGFDPQERAVLAALPGVVRLSLGPRVLRADTASVAALALVQASLGDWRGIGSN